MKDKLFEELMQSVREGGAILRGRRKPSRVLLRETKRRGRSQDRLPEPVERSERER